MEHDEMMRRIRELYTFVDREATEQVEKVRAMWEQPVAVRVREGSALASLDITEVTATRVTVRVPGGSSNEAKFRPGDSLRLHRGKPTDAGFNFSVTVDEENGDTLTLNAGFRTRFPGETMPGRGWFLDYDVVDVRQYVLSALGDMMSDPEMAGRFLTMVDGSRRPVHDAARLSRVNAALAESGLTATQREAVATAYATDSFALVQGPPGTGKTSVLAHLVHQLMRDGERVLVTACTHRAINNALNRVQATLEDGIPVFKVGPIREAGDLRDVPNVEHFHKSRLNRGNGPWVVGGTVYTTLTSRMRDVRFDTIIVDEASQMNLALAAVAFQVARRIVFIGDHQQMAPIVTASHDDPAVTKSIFETLAAHTPGVLLTETFRMSSALLAFPSSAFYKGKLVAVHDRRLTLNRPAGRLSALLEPEIPVVFVEVDHHNNTLSSQAEVNVVTNAIGEAIVAGVKPADIAIVSPFRAQNRLIRRALTARVGSLADQILVDTVERMQGQERAMICLSLVCSDPVWAADHAEFVFKPNRLNVAMTRAMHKLIIVGSPTLLTAKPTAVQHQRWVAVFRSLHASLPRWQVPEAESRSAQRSTAEDPYLSATVVGSL